MSKVKSTEIESAISLDTMIKKGKKKNIAGREYVICPVSIEDMSIIMNGEIFVPLEEKNENGEIIPAPVQHFGINITDNEKSEKFFYIVKKYVQYESYPMTKELLIEHKWSFTDIRDFLYYWIQIVSD